ncbi:MAG: riboflavin synthase [Pseudomonadota bacterium]|nr:riboflavin synthase [Pseudomonadota bacterium]
MFTGLVEARGTVRSVTAHGGGKVLWIAAPLEAFVLGESIACDGVCLTVEAFELGAFQVTAGEETLRRTTFADVAPGRVLHLERAMRVGDRLGGHIVQGHVDGVGRVRAVTPGPQWTRIDVDVPAELSRYLVEKGSVCIDGVSLTVNGIDRSGFHVGIVPHTLQMTNLGAFRTGHPVNLEVDILAKYVERLLGARGGGVDLPLLRAAGFTRE